MYSSPNNIDFSGVDLSYNDEVTNAYYHANKAYNYFNRESGEEPFNVRPVVSPFPAYVNLGGGICNAFSDGYSNNFYAVSENCDARSLLRDFISFTSSLSRVCLPAVSTRIKS